MVLSYKQEPVWTGHSSHISPEVVSEYLVSNPKKVEMAASSIYGTLPRVPKLHRRQMSEASIPVKYFTDPGKTSATKERKKSFFTGLKNKIRYAVDGKPKLHWSPSEDMCGSTGSLHREYSAIPENKTVNASHRAWTKGIESLYSSQRRSSGVRKSIAKKGSKDNVFPDYPSASSSNSSTPNSSAPSSPESQRSYLSTKRARRSGCSNSVKFRDNTNRDSFGSISPEETTKKSSGSKILIVGAEGVGKSALTVRFLTKRFIGEYAPEIESVYDQTVNLEGKDVNVHIWDSAIPDISQNSYDNESTTEPSNLTHSSSMMSVTSSGDSTSCRYSNRYSNSSLEDEAGNNNNNNKGGQEGMSRKNRLRHTINKTIRRFRNGEGSDTDDDGMTSPNHVLTEAERRLRWADGIVVVYSICEQSSFEAARDVIRYIRQTEAAELCRQGSNTDISSCRIPVLLVGNKFDLSHRRKVSTLEAQQLASSFGCNFSELSVSDGYEPVSEVMKDHLKVIRRVAKHRDGFKSKFRKNKW